MLLNNDGGSIFRRLPIAKFEPPFTPLFLTPHGLDFSQVARLYGVDYAQAQDGATFRQIFTTAVTGKQAMIIEVQTDGAIDLQHQQQLANMVVERITTHVQ